MASCNCLYSLAWWNKWPGSVYMGCFLIVLLCIAINLELTSFQPMQSSYAWCLLLVLPHSVCVCANLGINDGFLHSILIWQCGILVFPRHSPAIKPTVTKWRCTECSVRQASGKLIPPCALYYTRGGGTCVISHIAMECVAYNVYVRLLTFNLSPSMSWCLW